MSRADKACDLGALLIDGGHYFRQVSGLPHVLLDEMTEARRLKSGKWRLYETPNMLPVRDPATGHIATFESLPAARRWWVERRPQQPPPEEATKCARCGAYFGHASGWSLYAGRYYHPSHAPHALDAHRRR